MQKDMIETLKRIKANAFDFLGMDAYVLAQDIVKEIGHQNPDIRDDLIYEVLAHLFHDKHLNAFELTSLMELLMSDAYMFYDINNTESWSVLKRSFSILQLVVLVYVHRRDDVIDRRVVLKLFDDLMDYLSRESILIGYDEHVGWVHTIAHSADLMGQLMQLEYLDEVKLSMLFNAIVDIVKKTHHVYLHNEDERLVKAIKKGLERNLLSKTFLLSWLDQFKIDKDQYDLQQRLNLKHNIKTFLSSLYFSVSKDEGLQWFHEAIKHVLIDHVLKV